MSVPQWCDLRLSTPDSLADSEARGRVIRDGSDEPRLARARGIERLAQTVGVEPA